MKNIKTKTKHNGIKKKIHFLLNTFSVYFMNFLSDDRLLFYHFLCHPRFLLPLLLFRFILINKFSTFLLFDYFNVGTNMKTHCNLQSRKKKKNKN